MTQNVQFKLSNPVHFLALGFGSGLIKPAPGTWGTLSAIPLYWLLMMFMSSSSWLYIVIIVLSFVVGVYLCGQTAKDVGVHDHGAIVWDEIVGFFITMAFVPLTWPNVVFGFVLFRFFDIIKPWPIKLLDQHVHGGFGIMIDDVLAGIFAWALLMLAQPYLLNIFG
jgi:phosphatidylglycerophosphatase A